MREVVIKCDMPTGKKGDPCGNPVENEATVFTLEGVEYSADLCERHRRDLLDRMAPFVELADPVRSRSGNAVRKALKGKKGVFTTKEVREWLREQGREVAPSGRLPQGLIEEYKAAHGREETAKAPVFSS